jgi:hypothetical protein
MRLRSRIIPVLILLLAAAVSGGCGTFSNMKKSSENVVRDFRAPDKDLKKTVFRLAMNNQVTAAKQNIGAAIDSNYLDALPQLCSDLLLVGPEDSEATQALSPLFQKAAASFDNLALVRIGKQFGISAVVTSRFSAIAIRQKNTGILWFLKKLPFAWINVATEVYDTETGAKYLDQTFTRELKLDEEEADRIQKGDISSVPDVEKAVFESIQQVADAVCDAVKRRPWKGYVAKAGAETLTLSSGSRSGLSVGRELKVYDQGPRIQGNEGQTFLQPGKKIGEIRITAVFPDSAEAAIISGGGFQADNVVKTK